MAVQSGEIWCLNRLTEFTGTDKVDEAKFLWNIVRLSLELQW